MKVTVPVTVSDFEIFAKEGQRSPKLERKIPYFLAQLVGATTRERVEALCEEQLAWLRDPEGGGYTSRSIPNRVTKYKRAIQACFAVHPIPEGLGVPIKTKEHGMIDVHIAQLLLQSSADESQISVDEDKKKTDADQDNAQPFSMNAVIKKTEELVNHPNWRVAAAGLLLACQCRPTDLTMLGEFKSVSRYKVEFTTRLKKKNKAVTRTIFTIIEADAFVDAFSRIRRESSLISLQGLSPSEADSRTNKTINREVVRWYGSIIPAPFTEKVLSAHNLRAAGVRVAYHLYGKTGEDAQRFVELQLIHESKAASANYNDYYCVDEQGKEITAKGVRKDADAPLTTTPLSEKRSTLSLDKQLLAMVSDAERWGEGSHADRLERIIAQAEQADRLKAQLARECEKRQRLELELNLLRSSSAPSVASDPAVKAHHKVAKSKQAPEPVVEADTGSFNWRNVPNEVLNGDRRHDAYPEKLRRSVEAVQEYNAGRDDSDQFAITGSILRQLTKVKPGKVKEWMEAHKVELDGYNAGYSASQNRGKPAPREVIKWSEVAYGAYEW